MTTFTIPQDLFKYTTVLYVIAMILGIYSGITLNALDSGLAADSQDPASAGVIFIQILVFTVVILALIKSKLGTKIIRGFIVFALTLSAYITLFAITLNDLIAIPIALALMLANWKYPKNVLIKNTFATLATAGVGAILGVSLGVIPIIVFIVLLAIYDYIAVFKTKHMITLAKGLTKENIVATFEMPTKHRKKAYLLGTGDMVIPVAAATSAWIYQAPLAGVLVAIGALAGLLGTLYIVARKKIAMPAIPLIAAGIIIGLGLYTLTVLF